MRKTNNTIKHLPYISTLQNMGVIWQKKCIAHTETHANIYTAKVCLFFRYTNENLSSVKAAVTQLV